MITFVCVNNSDCTYAYLGWSSIYLSLGGLYNLNMRELQTTETELVRAM
jgi:hypothetical protein